MKLKQAHDYSLPAGVLGLAVAPDGTRAFVSCADGSVYAVDPATGKYEAFAARHESFASGCVLLPDGRTVISAGYDGWLLWHDVATRQCWRRVKAHTFWSWQLALAPDGRHLATVSGQYLPGGWKYEPAPETEPSVRVFDTLTGECTADLSHEPPVLSCAFSPDGGHLAAANMMGKIRVWKTGVATGAPPVSEWTTPDFSSWGTTKSHHWCGGIYGLAFSPDGNSLLGCGMGPMGDPMAGNGKMTWQQWDWRKGERTGQIRDGQHGTGLMESITWHPDGSHFLMAGRQAQGTWNTALFSAADGNLVHSLHTQNRATHTRFTADGKSLFVSGAQGQPPRKNGEWASWGRLQIYQVET